MIPNNRQKCENRGGLHCWEVVGTDCKLLHEGYKTNCAFCELPYADWLASNKPKITIKDMLCEAAFELTEVQQLDVLCRELNAELADMGLVPVSDWVRHHNKDCYVCKVDWIEDVEAEKGRGYNKLLYRTWSGA